MKKILLLALALIMVLSAFVACNPSDDSGETSKKPASTTPPESIGNLDPSIDLKEKEVVILSRNNAWTKDEISVEGFNADPINDAIHQRNINVEKLINVTLKNTMVVSGSDINTQEYSVHNELKKTFGPDCPYHIIASTAYTCFENTASGYYQNLLELDNLDLSQDYWSPQYNKQASIGNAQYFITGAASLTLRRYIFVTFFNKTLAENYHLDNLYEVVDRGEWTIDYQAEITANMYENRDSTPGVSEGDMFGFVTDHRVFVDPYVVSCNVQLLEKDSDNFFTVSPNKEKMDEMLKKLNRLYYGTGATYAYAHIGDYDQYDKILTKFAANEATMITQRLIACESDILKNMEAPYGIIPIPKFDEAQKEYYSLAHDQFTVFGVVCSDLTANMLDDLGAVLEAMAIESKRVVTPAYFEVALKGKYSKDPQSWEMLDKIANSLNIDGGLLYTISIGDPTQQIRNAVRDKKTTSAGFLSAAHITLMTNKLNVLQNNIKKIQE